MKRAKLTAQQQKKRDVLLDVLTVLFACPLISAAIAVFNVPNDIAPGGVAGLSTALAEVFPPISVGVWMVMLNTPLLLAAWRRFKRRALVMTLAATGSVAVLVDIFGLLLPAYSNNPLLAAIAGGTFTGLGAGLLLQRGISTGGTDLLALLLRRIFPNLRTGMLMLCIDTSVVTFAVIVFKDIEVALYSAIAIFIVSKIVDAIAQGVDYAKVIYTVTEHGDEVSRAVTERADRGTTIVKAQGGYADRHHRRPPQQPRTDPADHQGDRSGRFYLRHRFDRSARPGLQGAVEVLSSQIKHLRKRAVSGSWRLLFV